MSEDRSQNRKQLAFTRQVAPPRSSYRRDYSPILAALVLSSIIKLVALAVTSIVRRS